MSTEQEWMGATGLLLGPTLYSWLSRSEASSIDLYQKLEQ